MRYNLHLDGTNTTDRMRRVFLPQHSPAPIVNSQTREQLNLAVPPFVEGGRNVYDHAADTAERWADRRRRWRREVGWGDCRFATSVVTERGMDSLAVLAHPSGRLRNGPRLTGLSLRDLERASPLVQSNNEPNPPQPPSA